VAPPHAPQPLNSPAEAQLCVPSLHAPTPRAAAGAVDGQHARIDSVPAQAQPSRSGAVASQLIVGPPPPPPLPAPPSAPLPPLALRRPVESQAANESAHKTAKQRMPMSDERSNRGPPRRGFVLGSAPSGGAPMRHVIILSLLLSSPLMAKEPLTVEEAITDAERALDTGRIGDAINESEKLQRTHGLKKDEQQRLEVIVARCKLVLGKYAESEKLFAKRVKAAPDDTRLAEWYARALDGNGKGDAALALLSDLAKKDALQEGDSYWALAQLERQKGEMDAARNHAKLALEKPIVLQSDELDHEIHKFIDELAPKKK
jgi:tetratricopeptide (TPR) repeat protein